MKNIFPIKEIKVNKSLELAQKIYDLTMETRCEAQVQELFKNGIHNIMIELLEELDTVKRDYALIPRNPTVGMQVIFMHAPSVMAKEETSKELFTNWINNFEHK